MTSRRSTLTKIWPLVHQLVEDDLFRHEKLQYLLQVPSKTGIFKMLMTNIRVFGNVFTLEDV